MNTKNNFFDLARFALYLRMQWSIHKRAIFFSYLLAYGLLVFTYCWYCYIMYSSLYGREYAVYDPCWLYVGAVGICYLVFMSALAGARSFSILGTKLGRLSFFTLPASTFEKFLGSLLGVIILQVVSYGVVVLADLTRVAVFSTVYDEATFVLPVQFIYWLNSCWGVLLASSFMQLGAVCWQRLPSLKTGVVLFCMVLLILFVVFLKDKLFCYSEFCYPRQDWLGEVFFRNGLSAKLAMGIITLFNWVITYFRLKETDLVHRL